MSALYTPHLDNGDDQRILLLAMLPIGDTLLASPTMRAIRQRYPSARITALARPGAAALVRCAAPVDDVEILPKWASPASPERLARLLPALRARRYHAAVDFTSPAYKWIGFACGIPTRTYMKFDRLWWLRPGHHAAWQSAHASRHYYDCAQELDLPPWTSVDHRPRLILPESAHLAARRFLRGHGVSGDGGPIIVVHPGGAWFGGLKQWPVERYAALADRLCRAWDARIVVLGSADERRVAAELAGRMAVRPLMATGEVSLLTSLALVQSAALFIGNDSGLLHAAAALGSAFVGIFGPTALVSFHPIPLYPEQGILVQSPCLCPRLRHFVGGQPIWDRPCCRGMCRVLAAIDVDTVSRAADLQLGRLACDAARAEKVGVRDDLLVAEHLPTSRLAR